MSFDCKENNSTSDCASLEYLFVAVHVSAATPGAGLIY